MTQEIFHLQDGRKLSYALYGPLDGEPVLYFHGTPSSRLEPLILKNYNKDLEQLLHTYKISLIATDRPGIGRSTYNPGGSFYSFAKDVYELADHMQIKKCKVLCWSGGGPFVLSLAYHFSNLVQQVYIVAGFTRSFNEPRVFGNMNGNIYYFWAAKNIPGVMRLIMDYIGRKAANNPIPKWLSRLPAVDHDLLNDRAIINHFSSVTLNEACRSGSRGIVHEAAMYFNEIGYELNKIIQPVHYWRGMKDNTVTQIHAEAIEKQVPNAIMHYKQNGGHLSIYVNCIEEIMETIAANTLQEAY